MSDCGAKKEKCAAFPSRGLLPSRFCVTPSSRRKATVEKLRCRRKENVQIFAFEVPKISFVFSAAQRKKYAQIKGSLREGAVAERLKESARLSVFRRLLVPRAPSVTLTRDTFLPEEGSWRRAALPQKKKVRTLSFESSTSPAAGCSRKAAKRNFADSRLFLLKNSKKSLLFSKKHDMIIVMIIT